MNSRSHIFLHRDDLIVCCPGEACDFEPTFDLTVRPSINRHAGRITITGSFADLRRLHVVIGSCLAVFDTTEAARLRPADAPLACRKCGSTKLIEPSVTPAAEFAWCPQCGVYTPSPARSRPVAEPDGSTDWVDIVPASAATEWEPDIATGRRNCPEIVP